MEEGTIVQWYKREGDEVRRGEPLLEVMTDKANIDVEATTDGVLRRILAQADDIVPVNAVVAIVGSAGEVIEDDGATGRGGEGATDDERPTTKDQPSEPGMPESPHHPVAPSPTPAVHVSPRARRQAPRFPAPPRGLRRPRQRLLRAPPRKPRSWRW